MKRATFLSLMLLMTWCPTPNAKTIALDSATMADIDAAFKAGTLTTEGLVQLRLARIRSYDREGPSLHAVMILNPKAIETARELDAERKAKGPLPASRHSRGAQGQLQHRGSADDRRLRPARRFDSLRRRVRRGEAARRGSYHPGKDEHVRVCLTAFAAGVARLQRCRAFHPSCRSRRCPCKGCS
jgi:hypothetical protein